MTATITYTGDLRTEATHLLSGNSIETDAPTDNQGKGERFSPTDLVATALGSCMLTIMGIAASTHGIDINGTSCDIEKIMAANPRRIGTINATLHFPTGSTYTDKEKKLLEHAALTCPVFESLHPDCQKNVSFRWSGAEQG